MNIPATVIGYENGGRARVSLMEPIGPLARGQEVTAALRLDRPLPPSRKPQDFEFLHKKGLRIGGTVLLHRADVREGLLVSPWIETLKKKTDDLDIRVVTRVMCSILPPPRADSVMVEEAWIAFCNEAMKAKTISSVLGDVELSLAEPCLYGPCGIVFRGPSRQNWVFHEVPPREGRKPSEIVSELLGSVPRDYLALSRKAPSPAAQWETVPVVRLPIDPERQPRLSAQFANHPYASAGQPQFTLGTLTLRLLGSTWVVFDATPLDMAAELYSFDSPVSFSSLRLA